MQRLAWLAGLWAGIAAAATTPAFDRISKEAAEARQQNRIQDATALYERALKIKPAWAEGWWFLGELLYDQDRYAEGRDALRHLVALDHKTGPGFALLGLCEYETKEYGRALDHINEARRLGMGDDPQAKQVVLYHAAVLLTHFGQFDSAQQVLEKIVRTQEPGPNILTAAGLEGLRKPILPADVPAADQDLVQSAGRAVCAMVGKRPADAQRYFGELLAKFPDAPNVHYLYGSYLLLTNEEAGVREFEKEIELHPKQAEVLTTLALEYEKRGDADKAIGYARRAVEADPKFFAAHGVLGRLLANDGQVDKGIAELELARKQAPDSPQVHFSLAAAYAMAGRKTDAARERAEFVRLKQLADQTMGK